MSGSVFMPTSVTPSRATPDPGKHVNYVLGMVLGVDDFTQEFAYLAGRSELSARELGGYGVLRGLRVHSPAPPDAAKGPEVVVSAGTALTPEGRFVKVPLTQCAFVNEWIARNKSVLESRGVVVPGPPLGLFVVLSYAERTTDLVPIPGEPCRTEEESMAPSRVADDFKLELRLVAPERREQEAIGAYLSWLAGKLEVVDTGAPTLPAFLAALAVAAAGSPKAGTAAPGAPAGSPPSPIPAGSPIFEPPTFSLKVPRADAARYFREALRYFATLRAEWQGAGSAPGGTPPDEDALLLARLDLGLLPEALDADVWKVDTIAVDETERSSLLPLSYLQEATFALADLASKQAVTHALGGAGVRYIVAAAGTVEIKDKETDPSPEVPPTYNGLTAWASADGEVSVTFAGPSGAGLQYLVKALPVATDATFSDPSVSFGAFLPPAAVPGFRLIVNNGGARVAKADLVGKKLMIEVSAFGAG